uniref:Uncharacterized protein n=1 Tax=Oryza brachyantha TaxID=4533 RepID=J3KZN3_ORYBR
SPAPGHDHHHHHLLFQATVNILFKLLQLFSLLLLRLPSTNTPPRHRCREEQLQATSLQVVLFKTANEWQMCFAHFPLLPQIFFFGLHLQLVFLA